MRTLIRLGGCPGLSESSLGAQVILLVLCCGGSNPFVSFVNREGFDNTLLMHMCLLSFLACLPAVVTPVSAFPSHCVKVLYASFSKVHISTTACRKVSDLDHRYPGKLAFIP